jgi:hypothetical protein
MQKSTGSGDLTKGSQKTFRTGGLEAYQTVVETITKARRINENAVAHALEKTRFTPGELGTVRS